MLSDREENPAPHISPEMIEQLLAVGLPDSEAAPLLDHLQACSLCRCRMASWAYWGEFSTLDRP